MRPDGERVLVSEIVRFAFLYFSSETRLTLGAAATATAATEKRGGDTGPGPMHGEARSGVYDVEMNGVKRQG